MACIPQRVAVSNRRSQLNTRQLSIAYRMSLSIPKMKIFKKNCHYFCYSAQLQCTYQKVHNQLYCCTYEFVLNCMIIKIYRIQRHTKILTWLLKGCKNLCLCFREKWRIMTTILTVKICCMYNHLKLQHFNTVQCKAVQRPVELVQPEAALRTFKGARK